MTKNEVKELIKAAGLYEWQVAYSFGVTEATFSRWLRRDFDNERTEKLKSIVNELKKA
ncbi:MAG: hypothetical protein LIO62_04860 [Clostridiales bacterium]|nr:hypothetical protein [Clostridiales bacterium]